jgi:transport family protein 27
VEQVTAAARSEEKRLLPGVLLANKIDLTERRVVSPKLGSELAQQLGLMYFECSCKEYNGVEEPFYYLANEYHKTYGEKAENMANFA